MGASGGSGATVSQVASKVSPVACPMEMKKPQGTLAAVDTAYQGGDVNRCSVGAGALGAGECSCLLFRRPHCPLGDGRCRKRWRPRRDDGFGGGSSSLRRSCFLLSSPSFCLSCPVESELAPIPTRAIALLKKGTPCGARTGTAGCCSALAGKSRSMPCRVRPSKKAVCLNKYINLAENASSAQEKESCVR